MSLRSLSTPRLHEQRFRSGHTYIHIYRIQKARAALPSSPNPKITFTFERKLHYPQLAISLASPLLALPLTWSNLTKAATSVLYTTRFAVNPSASISSSISIASSHDPSTPAARMRAAYVYSSGGTPASANKQNKTGGHFDCRPNSKQQSHHTTGNQRPLGRRPTSGVQRSYYTSVGRVSLERAQNKTHTKTEPSAALALCKVSPLCCIPFDGNADRHCCYEY